jgi:chemotaxis protein CheX
MNVKTKNTAVFLLENTLQSVKEVLPFTIQADKPSILTQPYQQHSIGVLIGITGDIRGRLIIDGNEKTFSSIGEGMFGMAIEGELLESFAGELGNMFGGKLSTSLAAFGFNMDITPPTVLVGETKLYGFDKAFRLPISIENIGKLMLLLMFDE